ncbi:fluoride efflux transporter CrcB [Rhodobacter capsulatus]|jgi:CrcB protein|uniref:Fluoride-specific ion channel FluC n=1 Tax=Rhodobacter capsulatus (strain ATCC BAA-309 / NBRC 16581 / SB1003) TaxID=272942 RepID=D5AM26_RHOCB|nr:fluoride efflux transporter CrcB [Rhodobacter capsulatus]ADE84096.1 camphor resistance protein CrcB [Rhodobacter capsulatus SB 1003]ETD86124.1 camphor resistance protein CrcB [Rhodobacter capsulatus YW1]ETD90136.1 camphor resistance protein CrcB [Rhodobacter capsulatus YW2]MDS0925691.1 fluoride efflux transporter CrcB [Rhodobacter capsulatus]TQD36182.1 fluoride efflux transporter CrcB [Rhodobacter capsulatus]
MIQTLLFVALGGALGSALRYLVNITLPRLVGHGFPYATMTVNVLGSFAMGVLVVVLAMKGGTRFAPFLMTGILGGFTTFSAFSLDAAKLVETGEIGTAAVYVLGSVGLGLAALFAGMAFARGFFA